MFIHDILASDMTGTSEYICVTSLTEICYVLGQWERPNKFIYIN